MRIKCRTLDRPKRASKDLRRIHPGLKLSAAQQTTAFVYGYKDWHELQSVTEKSNAAPSPDDEELSDAALIQRRSYQGARFIEATGCDAETAANVINIWRPSARQPLSATIEELGGNPNPDDDEEPLDTMVRAMTMDDMRGGIGDFARRVLGHDVDPDQLISTLREVQDYDYGVWWDLLSYLGWTLEDWNEAPGPCTQCFTTFSRRLGRKVPVVTEKISFQPDDKADADAQRIFAAVAQRYPRGAIVMFRFMLTTEFEGKSYTYGGQFYHQGTWRPFALSQTVTGVDDILQQFDEGFSFDHPLTKYEDAHGGILARTLTAARAGVPDGEQPEMMGLRSGRWVQYMV